MIILVCFGTRPEYIKVKSLIDNLSNVKICFTGQHTDLIKNVKIDYQLEIDDHFSKNRLNCIVGSVLRYDKIFHDVDYVLVQGDTSSALAIALSAFNYGKKVIHLEAGLRTHNILSPYPEELNRQLISRITSIHLCPTELNKLNLLNEKVGGEIYVTGNTGLDNIIYEKPYYGDKVLITLHRRDNHNIMDKWFSSLAKIAKKYSSLQFILPIHPNPNVQKHRCLLSDIKNLSVCEPLGHDKVVDIVKECLFIISDSGGLQEEASYLHKKIVICREMTERPEVLGECGTLCKNPDDLENMVDEIYTDYKIDDSYVCPFRDPVTPAWKIILDVLNRYG